MYQIALSMTDKISKAISDYKELLSNVDWAEVATVVIAGVGIVLGVLIVLIGVFGGFGAAVSGIEKAAKNRKLKKAAKKAAKNAEKASDSAAPVQAAAPAAKPAPVVEQGISGEVVAAITAAVAASEGNGAFVIRSVKRKDVGSRNPWARAAVQDNTRSF